MFNFNNSQADPQTALENARDAINRDLMGGLTKAFMGQGFVDMMNAAMDHGQEAMDGVDQMNWVARHGLEARAKVVSVVDTGTTINMNPVVELSLKVTPYAGGEFGTVSRAMISRITVPRKGDQIRIKYIPDDPTRICVMP